MNRRCSTFITVYSNIDYLITHFNNIDSLCNVHIFDITEFSDHCPLTFSLKCNMKSDCFHTKDKIVC